MLFVIVVFVVFGCKECGLDEKVKKKVVLVIEVRCMCFFFVVNIKGKVFCRRS